MNDDALVTLLTTRLDSFEKALGRLEEKLDSGQFLSADVYEARHEALTSRVSRLEESRQWVLRTLAVQTLGLVGLLVSLGLARLP